MKGERAIVRNGPGVVVQMTALTLLSIFAASPLPPPTTANFTQIEGLDDLRIRLGSASAVLS